MSEDVLAQEAMFHACAHTGGVMVLVPIGYECATCKHDADSLIMTSLDVE